MIEKIDSNNNKWTKFYKKIFDHDNLRKKIFFQIETNNVYQFLAYWIWKDKIRLKKQKNSIQLEVTWQTSNPGNKDRTNPD